MLFTKCAVVLKLCTQYNQCEHNGQFEYIKVEYFDSVRGFEAFTICKYNRLIIDK